MNSKYISNIALRQYIVTVSLLIVAITSVQYYTYRINHQIPHMTTLENFPNDIGEWVSIGDYKFDKIIIDTLKVDEYLNRVYSKDKHQISLYIGNYFSHRKFVEIHTPENCQANSGWELLEKKVKIISAENAPKSDQIHLVEALYSKDGKKYLLAYTYKLMHETTTSFFTYKYMVIRNSIMNDRSDAQFIRVLLQLDESNPSESVQIVERFVTDMFHVLFQKMP